MHKHTFSETSIVCFIDIVYVIFNDDNFPTHCTIMLWGGTQIWIGWGCAACSSRPIPMFKGNFSQNKYSYLGIFPKKKRCPFLRICHKNTKFSKFSEPPKNQTHSYGYFHKKWDPCIVISCKKPTPNCSTSPYVLTCESPPPGGL